MALLLVLVCEDIDKVHDLDEKGFLGFHAPALRFLDLLARSALLDYMHFIFAVVPMNALSRDSLGGATFTPQSAPP